MTPSVVALRTSVKTLVAHLCCLILLLTGGCAGSITRASDGRQLEFDEMMREIQDARLILIGETHDSKRHHRFQLQVIQALQAQGKRLAIGAEMFTAASQKQLEIWNAGIMDRLSFQWLYQDNWSEPWPLYRDIFLFAHDNGIPVVGLNYGKELMRKISSHGVEGLSAADKAQLPTELSCDPSSRYTALLRSIYQGHTSKSRSFEEFCSAQLLWNRGMAGRLAGYLDRHPDQTVVALVGALHALKGAIPAEMPTVELRVLVPELPGYLSRRESDYEFR